MGWRFSARHANIVAFITSKENGNTPRVSEGDLLTFLYATLYANRGEKDLFSRNDYWIESVRRMAEISLSQVEKEGLNDVNSKKLVDKNLLESTLQDFKKDFSSYSLYVLFLGSNRDIELDYFFRFLAISGEQNVLALHPMDYGLNRLEFLDPLPQIQLLFEQPATWPGALFWTKSGAKVYVSLEKAIRLFTDIKEIGEFDLQKVDRIINGYATIASEKRILHISDLHLGTEETTERSGYLISKLKQYSSSFDKIVITGDLLDEPSRSAKIDYGNFKNSVNLICDQEIIVIPGNHDLKTRGFLGVRLKEFFDIEWSPFIVDDRLGINFFCFNSSENSSWATGKIERQQMFDVATRFESELAVRPSIERNLNIGLIHHHLFDYRSDQEQIIDPLPEYIGRLHRIFVKMDNAEKFLLWCARRNIKLVMHGHNHVQRYVNHNIKDQERNVSYNIDVVGCGSSLGKGSQKLSFNIIWWEQSTKRWSVSFYRDSGDGSGFELISGNLNLISHDSPR